MKRLKIPTYILRTKWILLAAIAVILVIFGRTVNSPSLTKTAIVIGVGIDYLEETSEFEVSTQSVLMASSSGDSSGQTAYETFTGTGKTIAAALGEISRKMGLIVSLAHCEVLFLSQSALKLDHLQLLYPLTGMFSLREQAVVVSSEKSPREILSTRVGTTVSAPYFLQNALKNQEGTDGLIKTTAKDLLARSLSRSEATAIPYIVAVEMSDQPMDDKEDQKGNYELDLSRILVFSHDKSEVVEQELAEILAIYLSENTYGSLNYTYPDGQTVEFRILDKSVSTSAKGRNVTAEIELTVDLLDVQFIPTDDVLTGASPFIKRTAGELATELEKRMTALYEKSKEWNIDFLGLQAKAYQSVGRTLENDCLGTIQFVPKIKISVKEAA